MTTNGVGTPRGAHAGSGGDSTSIAAAPEARRSADDPHIQALENQVLAVLLQAKRTMHERAERITPGMPAGTFNLFICISRLAPISAGALADHLTVDRSAVSRTTKALVEAGLVERHPNPEDGRGAVFTPTEHGQNLLDQARQSDAERFRVELSRWSRRDIVTLTELLGRITSEPGASSPLPA
ncbi:MAG: MarR family winged helix-turn-helix transcriptional regulator [Mycetocola sp.]